MRRKWTILAAVMFAVTLTATGVSLADEDSPIHKLMEKVGSKGTAIKKAIRTPVAYKKDREAVIKHAEDLIDLGKKAKDMKESAEKQKKEFSEWQKLCDDFIKKSTDFKEFAEKSGTTKDDQEAAKKAYATVNASCTSCHNVFRVDDDK